jgi:hypothetical protein
MKKGLSIFILTLLVSISSFSQYAPAITNPSFRYVATPGFVNTTEIIGGMGLCYCCPSNSDYFFGITNVFGYQISRNFLGGIGIGYFQFEDEFLLPLYLENKYSFHLKSFTPYIYADAGVLVDPAEIKESKIFINPGLGVSRSVSPHLEINLSAGYMVHTRSSSLSFFTLKAGVIYRKNAFRMFKSIKSDRFKKTNSN